MKYILWCKTFCNCSVDSFATELGKHQFYTNIDKEMMTGR